MIVAVHGQLWLHLAVEKNYCRPHYVALPVQFMSTSIPESSFDKYMHSYTICNHYNHLCLPSYGWPSTDQNEPEVTLPYILETTCCTHHVSPAQPAEYISMPRGPTGLRCDWRWGQGSRGHPSGAGSESAFCCTAERWAPMWRPSPVCCNCRGGGAPEEGWALGPWGALSCWLPGPWCTLAGWHSHEPGEDQVKHDGCTHVDLHALKAGGSSAEIKKWLCNCCFTGKEQFNQHSHLVVKI